MASYSRKQWQPQLDSGRSRRDRAGCTYDAYLPDGLAGRRFSIDGDVAADIADAEAAIARLNVEAVSLVDSEALARLLLRAEAVASSRIEGLHAGGRRLLRAEVERVLGDEPSDVTAEEILANVRAMAWAVESVAANGWITLEGLLETHRVLLGGTRIAAHGGRIREEQNWIGGSSYNPCRAAFVPPPPEHVRALLDDLCEFCNEDSLPAVAQAALAHAQFETIHPFVDGNGRTGRALIHVILRRRGLAVRVLPPVSLVLAARSEDYVGGLGGTRYGGERDGAAAREGMNRWLGFFAAACHRAAVDALAYEAEAAALQSRWRAAVGKVRRGSAADLLLQALPGTPIITVSSGAKAIGRSVQATNEAVNRLAGAGVLRSVKVGRKRHRGFEADGLVEAYTALEARLAAG
jgi:Fic family protein